MNFLEFLQSNKNTRKVFGARELRIIEKQLSGVNLTQSEKNRLSRDIRTKLAFIEKASVFSEDFRVKKGAIITELIKDAKNEMLSSSFSKRIKRIILYGSAAENKLTLNSDIDLAVEFSDIDVKDATIFRKEVLGKVDSRIDIQVYETLPEKIKEDIKTTGKLVYGV